MKVKIIGKNTGLGNQIQFIPFIEKLKQNHEVLSDSNVFHEFGILPPASMEKANLNIVLFGYNYQKFFKEWTPTQKFAGFKYRIKGRHIGLGYSVARRFDENLSEVENNRLLYNRLFEEKVESVNFHLPGKKSVPNRVVIGISPKEEKTIPYQLWKEVIEALRSRGFEVLIVDKDIGVEGYVKTPSLKALKETIGSAEYYLGNDSGPMHLADILGIPSLVMFGATDITKNGPQNKQSITLTRGLSCSPCFDWGRVNCPIQFECMNFRVDEIMRTFDQLCSR